jgi:hypothetical protein
VISLRVNGERHVRLLLAAMTLMACARPPTMMEHAAALRCDADPRAGVLVLGEFRRPGRVAATPGLTVDRAIAAAGGLRESYEIALVHCGRTFHISHAPEPEAFPLSAGDLLIAPDPASVF